MIPSQLSFLILDLSPKKMSWRELESFPNLPPVKFPVTHSRKPPVLRSIRQIWDSAILERWR